MVDKIIRWIVRLLYRHGYVIASKDEYAYLINKVDAKAIAGIERDYLRLDTKVNEFSTATVNDICACEERITTLEQQQNELKQKADNYTASDIINEWLNGEAAPGDRV